MLAVRGPDPAEASEVRRGIRGGTSDTASRASCIIVPRRPSELVSFEGWSVRATASP